MTASIELLKKELEGIKLPGSPLTISALESQVVDETARDPHNDTDLAHPIWFVIASLRGMGISVDELCALAHKGDNDTLLFGGVEVVQEQPLVVGRTLNVSSEIVDVERKSTREGGALDSLTIRNVIADSSGDLVGTVTCAYLFKRGATKE